MSAGQEFWMVAAAATPSEKREQLNKMKSIPGLVPARKSPDCGVFEFEVPNGKNALTVGSFETVIRLTDDLQKYDQQVDSLVHRLERQCLELEPKATLNIRSQTKQVAFMDYIKNWQWDEHKFPKSRPIVENIALLVNVVNKLDEEARNRTTQYNEVKQQKTNLAKKDNVNLTGRELVDVLTPDVVVMGQGADDDFIMTEHLTTVPVILQKNSVAEFLTLYESFHENIVPRSAKKFEGLDDKDGYSVWRVVMFKNAVEGFKKHCRDRRYLTRDFEYDANAHKKLEKQRAEVDKAESDMKPQVLGLYQAAWSDAMIAWVHIKAMRIFIEGLLRFGNEATFASYIMSPKANAQVATRKALEGILGQNAAKGPAVKKGEDDDEEFFPYVSVSFMPFATPKGGN